MISPTLPILTLIILTVDFLVNAFYLKKAIDMYKKEKASVGGLFIAFFTIRIMIIIFQAWGIVQYPEREMLSDTVALGAIFTGYLGIMILETYRDINYDGRRLAVGGVLATLTSTFIFLARSEKIGSALKEAFPYFIQASVPLFFLFVGGNVYQLTRDMLSYATLNKDPRSKKSVFFSCLTSWESHHMSWST